MTAVWLIPTRDGFLLLGYVIAVLVFFSLGAYTAAAGGRRRGVCRRDDGRRRDDTARPRARAGRHRCRPGRHRAGRDGPAGGHQRRQTALLEELTGRLVQERATAERAAVAEERARIARELHDVIGHEVTVIALQADAAAAALVKAPERAAAPVEAIRRSADGGAGGDAPGRRHAAGRRGGGPAPAARAHRRDRPGGEVPGRRSHRGAHPGSAGPAHARQRRAGRLPAGPGGPDQRAAARPGAAGRRPRRRATTTP